MSTIEDWGRIKWDTIQTNSYNTDSGTDVEVDSAGNIYFIGTTGGGVGIKKTILWIKYTIQIYF